MKKGLRISVYKFPNADCTNKGLSSNHEHLTLIGDGIAEVFAPSADAPAVTLVKKEWAEGRFHLSLVPCDENAVPLEGWFMFGGNFGYTSDGRFSDLSNQPIHIHDRKEF